MSDREFGGGEKFIDTLKDKQPERTRQVKLLNTMEQAQPARNRRRSARLDVPDGVTCTFSYGDKIERDIWFKSPIRNLSDHGIGIIHGAFVYVGSEVILHLKMPDGEVLALGGVVRRCTFVSGKAHDLGIEFQSPIDAAGLLGIETG
jgi:hypothetical protein